MGALEIFNCEQDKEELCNVWSGGGASQHIVSLLSSWAFDNCMIRRTAGIPLLLCFSAVDNESFENLSYNC